MKDDIYAQSNSDIIRELGTRFKDYRKRMGYGVNTKRSGCTYRIECVYYQHH